MNYAQEQRLRLIDFLLEHYGSVGRAQVEDFFGIGPKRRSHSPTQWRLKMTCQHMNFDAEVRVARIEDKGRFMAEIRIRCLDCGIPMQFMGLKPGLDFNGATVSLDGLEANIGIHPQGQQPNPLQKLMGYTVCDTN